MPTLLLPDGSSQPVRDGLTLKELSLQLKDKLPHPPVAGKIAGELADLDTHVEGNVKVEFVFPESEEGLTVIRHSASHVMADAVKRLFPGVKLAIGPATKDGFYYDFDLERRFTEDDFPKIEAEMRRIIEEDFPFHRSRMRKEEAIRKLEAEGECYKVELVRELPDEMVTFYTHNGFTDLCKGPHVPSTGWIKAFKLLSVAGAYWRGSEQRPMLQRIYGCAFWTQEALDAHLKYLEEVKHRDHRLLGKMLDFFSTDDEVGPGLILWHPRGAMVRHIIEDFWRKEHLKRDYQLVYTPHIASERIYMRSGHLENYSEFMYGPMEIEEKPYRIKPMNCPGHIKIFQSAIRSYRDLPIRYAELGTVYRYERSGTLHGLLRVRGFTQDDAHIFCTPEQLAGELAGVLDLANMMMRAFGYDYHAVLATRPEKSLGTEEEWTHSTNALKEALSAANLEYTIDEGGGAFYGPKIDIKLLDALGREWTGPTIQVDLNLPRRFNVTYVAADGKEHPVVIVHRTVLGSMERFVGSLLEHYGGAFPVWLSPEQVRVIPISEAHVEYALLVGNTLRQRGIRTHVDLRGEKVGYKIREATLAKVPYMLIVGDREVREKMVAVRHRREGDMGLSSLDSFLTRLEDEIARRV